MKALFGFVCSLFLTAAVSAQTLDEIISKHIEAIGGKDVLAKSSTLYAETSTSIMGNDAPGKLYIVNGKGYKSEMEMMGSTMIQCITPNGGWLTVPMSGEVQDMPAEQFKSMQANLSFGGIFIGYPANGAKIELSGKKKINDSEAFKLKVTPKDGNASTYYIDSKTYYIVRTEAQGEMMGQAVDITTNFSDHKKLENGYVWPHKIAIDLGQFSLTTSFTKVELNKTFEDGLFDKGK